MIQSDDVRKGSFLDVIIWAGIWVALLHVVLFQTGCSFQVGIDWHGETAKDDKTFTQKK